MDLLVARVVRELLRLLESTRPQWQQAVQEHVPAAVAHLLPAQESVEPLRLEPQRAAVVAAVRQFRVFLRLDQRQEEEAF